MRRIFGQRGLAAVAVAGLVLAAVPARAEVIDFDALAVGTPVTEVAGVQLSENIAGYGLAVVSRFATTSGDRGLGIADGGFEVLFPGDVLTLDFASPVTSLAISFVSSPNTPANAFTITTSAGTATSGATPDQVLADQGEVFTVVLQPAQPFSQAVITAGAGIYSYNLDDITFAPEPAPGLALASGVAGLLMLDHARRRVRPTRRIRS